MKRKNLEVKESGTMVEKTQFEVEVSARDTINKEEIKGSLFYFK